MKRSCRDTEKDGMALGIKYSLHSFPRWGHPYDSEWGLWLEIITMWQLHWQHMWNLLMVDLLPSLLRVSVRPLLAGQEEQKKTPQLTNNSCPNVVLEAQDGDSDGYEVRNCAVLLLWQACSSDKSLTPRPEPVIPSPFLSTTFTLSLLFIYFILLNNCVLWPVKNWEGSYHEAQEGD